MYPPPPLIETEVYARMPAELHRTDKYSAWVERRGAGPLHSFLEGPSFDRAGNLYCVDLAHGRVFRIAPDRSWTVFAEYEGIPNGLKIHRDGRIFVADHQNGILCFDPHTGARTRCPTAATRGASRA
jgi:gluconolactonase